MNDDRFATNRRKEHKEKKRLFAPFEPFCGQSSPLFYCEGDHRALSRSGERSRDDLVAPAVILWPDKERQWEPVLPVLRERLPHLLTLGSVCAH